VVVRGVDLRQLAGSLVAARVGLVAFERRDLLLG
jgi:hypothetical protein